MSLRPYPEVLILGAMRTGTTFLHRALTAHPGVVAPREKELQFFTLGWERGPRAYRRQLPLRWPRWVYALGGKRRPMTIDASPYYLFHPDAPARAASLLPQSAKMIVLLREPGARAWSHYRHSLARGAEHLGFHAALACEEERLAAEGAMAPREGSPHQRFSYAARGLYAEQLERWWRHFPRENFLVLRSDAMFADPQATLDRVCRFLGLSLIALPDQLPHNALAPEPIPEAARAVLTARFAEPNAALADLTGIDFGSGKPIVHLLHIGKTGGMALKAALRPWLEHGPYSIRLHDHDFTLRDVPVGEKAVLFLRDPVSRFVSGFYSRQREGRPLLYRAWRPAEAEAFAEFATPDALATALSSEDTGRRVRAEAAMRGIAHVRDSFYRWIESDAYLKARREDVLFMGDQARLTEDFHALARLLGLPEAALPDDNVIAHRNPPAVDRRLGAVAIANLREWYARDIAFYARLSR